MKIRRFSKTFISAFMTLVMLAGLVCVAPVSFAVDDIVGGKDYTITNPYENVNWDTWTAYTGATHVHSHLSDGSEDFDEMVEAYYSAGYDCLSMTDHGTVNYGWTADKDRHTIFTYQSFVHGSVSPLSQARATEINNGVGRSGRGMIDVPLGIELNGASTKKVHVNSYFADAGDGDMELSATWPSDAVAKSHNAGGITHINHVGEWTDAKDDIGVYSASFVNDFANIFTTYSSCVGMELVNTSDSRTRNDRYLYDETLKLLAPSGRNIFGFCEDDSHEFGDIGKNAQFFMMPSNTAANVRTAMETGAFFACSKNAKNANELGDGFAASGNFPSVSRITVDEEKDQITVNCAAATKVRLVADGVVIATQMVSASGDTVTFDLNSYENQINSYVRIYLTGAGGICYVQPFLLTSEEITFASVQFNLPSADTSLTVKDGSGTVVAPTNSVASLYVLDAGNYTYSASRNGYVSISDVPFTVTPADVANGTNSVINVTLEQDVTVSSVYFYVPETIYLTPTAGTMNTFKYYADRANAVDGALTRSGTDTSGNIFFNCDGATSVTVSVNSVAASATNGSINFRNGYTVNGSTVSTAITAGKLATALSAGGSTVLAWTATYVIGGETFTSNAFSFVYAPQTGEVSAAIRHYHTYSTDVYNQGVLWAIGFHSVSGGSYICSKNFFTDSAPTSDTGISGWFTGYSNGGSTFSSHKHTSNAADTHSNTSGRGIVTVDSSRVTNLNQVPNLRVGFWQCDSEGDGNVSGWIKQTADSSTSTIMTVTDRGNGEIYDNAISYPNAENLLGTKSLSFSAYGLTGRGNRKNHNYYYVNLDVNYISKNVLRSAYNAAIMQAFQSADYSAASYNAYSVALVNAGAVLGNPAATAAQVNTAAANLNSAINALG